MTYPRDALAFFAPAEAPAPEDDVRITPVRQEQLKERLGDRYRELDAPLFVEWPDGRRGAVVFALEEESDWRRFSPHRLAHYCLHLAEMLDTDRVVPVVVFLRTARRAPESLVPGTERRTYLRFEYLGCKLAEEPAERWLASDNVVARVNLPNMDGTGRDRVDVYAHAVRGLLTLETDGAKREEYLDFIDIYAGLTDNEMRRYRREQPEESSIVTGFVQRARAEGIERESRRVASKVGARCSSDSCGSVSANCRPARPNGLGRRPRPSWRLGPTTCWTRRHSTRCFARHRSFYVADRDALVGSVPDCRSTSVGMA